MRFSNLVKSYFEQELALLLNESHHCYQECTHPETKCLVQIESMLLTLLSSLLYQLENHAVLFPTFGSKVKALKGMSSRWLLLDSSALEFLESIALFLEGSSSVHARLPAIKELQTFVEELSVQVSLRVALERASDTLLENQQRTSEQYLQRVVSDYDRALMDLKSALGRDASNF
jgi:hypothetical protein